MTNAGEQGGGLAHDPPEPVHAAQSSKVRAVLRIVPGRAGTSELHLSCGHTVRRRLKFCPPSKIVCPSC
jgi:hypothetical protein